MTYYEPESEWLRQPSPNGCHPLFILPSTSHVYVDLGCSHPTSKSLTHFVRDLGWRGVAIDGNPDYEKDWIDAGYHSHFLRAILSPTPRARFAIHENCFTSRLSDSPATDRPELWGINRVVEEDVHPLNFLLQMRGIEKIDLLCCDLEGNEFDVLQTLDWEKHQPSFIISEYVTHGEGVDPRVAVMLLARGYEIIHVTESNFIFRRK